MNRDSTVVSRLARWGPLAVVSLAVLLYLNILPNTFIFDDWQQIFDNPFLRYSGGLKKIFTTNVWGFLGRMGISNYYRPLMHSTFYVTFRMLAGSPSVLASLWEVNDRSTLRLMRSFYGHLRQGDKAEALAQAQRTMLRAGGRFRHPYYWAPFVLVGEMK